jgi:hypothetical protein
MKKFWAYISTFLIGMVTGLIAMVLIVKNKLSNNTIEINRPKIKNSPNGEQDFTNDISSAIKKMPNKRDERKLKRRARKSINNLKNSKI